LNGPKAGDPDLLLTEWFPTNAGPFSAIAETSCRCAQHEEFSVAQVLVKELIEAGVHFGHRASRWNPKMRPYIYARQNLIHIVDVRETIRGLLRARKYLKQLASAGDGLVLFVGTKRQAGETIEREAERAKMPYVSDRWLGGTLTNFRTIRNRLTRLEELESLRSGDQLSTYSKKMQSALMCEYRKMYRNLHGIRTMHRLPECLVVIDPKKERNAIREAQKLGITTVALIDTDSDPDVVDLPIPGNDDSIRSIELIVRQLADAIIEGRGSSAAETQRQKSEVGEEQPVG
jgi:small subunit ribosomal protein S2